jgi:hypothetical protein
MLRSLVIFTMVARLAGDAGPPLPDRLSPMESANFAKAAYRAELMPSYRERSLGLDFEGAKPNPHFYTWTIVPTWGEGVAFFAVDRRTGDVWPALGCERVRSPELAALQARFRQRFGVPAWRVRQIEAEGDPIEGCD